MDFKVIVQARKAFSSSREDAEGPREKVVTYDISAGDSEEATEEAARKFQLDHGLEGWEVVGIGSLQM